MDNTIRQMIGEQIKILREDRNWSQEKLAELANMNPSYVSKIERGTVNVTIQSLDKIIAPFEISVFDLFHSIKPLHEHELSSPMLQIIQRLRNHSIDEQKKALQLLEFVLTWKS
jgi:transcriptional regulator with XRE-family HTH domain